MQYASTEQALVRDSAQHDVNVEDATISASSPVLQIRNPNLFLADAEQRSRPVDTKDSACNPKARVMAILGAIEELW